MTNLEKYTKIFVEIFQITESEAAGLTYQSIQAWDSVGHMELIARLEAAFEIMMETEDIIDLSSFAKGRDILRKYDVEIE